MIQAHSNNLISINMAKMVKKSNLPEKECPVCKFKFSWRKKWEKNWEEVKYCSEKCRNNKQAIVPS